MQQPLCSVDAKGGALSTPRLMIRRLAKEPRALEYLQGIRSAITYVAPEGL